MLASASDVMAVFTGGKPASRSSVTTMTRRQPKRDTS